MQKANLFLHIILELLMHNAAGFTYFFNLF